MADFTSILESVGKSISPLQQLATGFCYLVGLMFAIKSLSVLKRIGNFHARSPSGIKMFVPIAYMLGAAAFVYLPTFMSAAENTFFGLNSPLSYKNWFVQVVAKYGDPVIVVFRLIETAGILWFLRGLYLLVKSSEPGMDEAGRGMAFMVAGILAMNFSLTINWIANIMNYISTQTS